MKKLIALIICLAVFGFTLFCVVVSGLVWQELNIQQYTTANTRAINVLFAQDYGIERAWAMQEVKEIQLSHETHYIIKLKNLDPTAEPLNEKEFQCNLYPYFYIEVWPYGENKATVKQIPGTEDIQLELTNSHKAGTNLTSLANYSALQALKLGHLCHDKALYLDVTSHAFENYQSFTLKGAINSDWAAFLKELKAMPGFKDCEQIDCIEEANYYCIIQELYPKKASNHVSTRYEICQLFVRNIAQSYGVVCLPTKGSSSYDFEMGYILNIPRDLITKVNQDEILHLFRALWGSDRFAPELKLNYKAQTEELHINIKGESPYLLHTLLKKL